MIYVQILLILFVYNVRKQNPAGGGSGAFANREQMRGGRSGKTCAHRTKQEMLFCLFCRRIHLSAGNHTRFCTLTKINVEISPGFVYNVTVRVLRPSDEYTSGRQTLSRKE
ncbi:MAG: hypothetical protein PUD66_04260, partial [Oscillospiraceae bacterium]|nr:hypothetical protein [Oscillospiraceae bacterium]